MFKKLLAIACLSLSLIALESEAALLLVDGTGQLTGATGVNVNGALFDVSFGDGSCISLFGGCDSSDDFTFKTLSDSTDAAEALLAQVFLGTFDHSTQLTQGCEDSQQCRVYVAYGFDNVAGRVQSIQASNWRTGAGWPGDSVSGIHPSNVPDANNVLSQGWRTYAVFNPSVVSAPASVWLLGAGLLGLIGVARKRVPV